MNIEDRIQAVKYAEAIIKLSDEERRLLKIADTFLQDDLRRMISLATSHNARTPDMDAAYLHDEEVQGMAWKLAERALATLKAEL